MASKCIYYDGYTYANLDNCWYSKPGRVRFIQTDPVKLKSGIKVLSYYAYSKEMELNICMRRGTNITQHIDYINTLKNND